MKCLSVKNPWGYLICAGIKDVENRTWKTDYRGELYIHASGEETYDYLIPGWEHLLPLHYEASRVQFSEDGEIIRGGGGTDYLQAKNGECYIRGDAPDLIKKEYEMFKKIGMSDAGKGPLRRQAIIGKCMLVDIICDSKSPWAREGQYHWILRNQEIFDDPILYVKGALKIFDYSQNRRV